MHCWDQFCAAQAVCKERVGEAMFFWTRFFSEHKCFLCLPDNAEPTRSGNTPAFVPLQRGWFCSSHFGCSSVMKSSMPWFQKGQQFTAPDGTQGGALPSLRSWCVTADWGHCSFPAPSGHSHISTTLMSQFSLRVMRVLRWSLVLHPSTQPGAQLRMDPQKMRWLRLGFIYMCLICSGCHNKTPQTGASTTVFS